MSISSGKTAHVALWFACILAGGLPSLSYAATNIDLQSAGQKYGWTENGGWFNMQGDVTNGVYVGPNYLSGFAWHESFGWINFGDGFPEGTQYSNMSATDFGVNRDAVGQLSGYAWGENIGWIAFNTVSSGGSAVTVDEQTGQFSGHAWGENIGWVSFQTVDPAHVAHTATTSQVGNWSLY